MRLLIKPLMPRPKLASRLNPELERWIFDALEVNNPQKRMTRTLGTTKRISLPKILLLMHYHMGLNPFQHSPRRTRTVILAKKDPDNKAKARILLPLVLTLLPLGKRKTYLTLNATLVSKKVIMPTSTPRKSQKTNVGHDDLYIGD